MDTICICKPYSSSHSGVGIFRSKRTQPPASYLFQIQSYSLLMNTKYVSNDFQIGGHKWKLVLHPGDNSQKKDKGYVSLYLQIADTEKYANGWKVNVNFKLFVYDQMHKNYLTIQDAGDAVRTFSEKNTELGFEELISLKEFKDKSNGYLVNDSCEFGAEVYVYGHSAKSEILSMIKNPTHESFKWKFGKFSTLNNSSYESNIQHVGERDWSLWIYPKGNSLMSREYLSLFLELKNCAANRTVYATYTIKILDQLHNRHHQKIASSWFRPSSAVAGNWMKAAVTNWLGSSGNGIGYSKFISLSELNKASNGFIVKDVISMEVEIQVSMTKFSS